MTAGRARTGDQWARVVTALLPILLVAVGLQQVLESREASLLLIPAALVVGVLTGLAGRWLGLVGVVAAVGVAFSLRPSTASAALITVTAALALASWAAVALVNSRRPATAVLPVLAAAGLALVVGLSGKPQAVLLMAGAAVAIALLLLVTGSWTGAGEGQVAAVSPTVRSVAWSGAALVLVGLAALGAGALGDTLLPERSSTVSVAPTPVTAPVVVDVRDPLTEATRWQTQENESTRELMTLLPPVSDSVRPVWLSMAEYNGGGWVVPVFFRSAPGIIPPEPGVEVTSPVSRTTRLQVDVGLPGPWVPVPQRVTQVLGGNAPRVNIDSGVIATVSSPIGGTFETMYVQPQVTDAQLARAKPLTVPGDPALVVPGPLPPSLISLRASVVDDAGSATWARLTALAERMQTPAFRAAAPNDLPIEGPGRTLDDLGVVIKSRRGFQEQYAAAFAMIARTWGVPTRLCIGFLPEVRRGGTRALGGDTSVWVEARLAGLGWVAFQPSPQDRAAGREAVVRPPRPTSTRPTPSPTASGSATPTPRPTEDGAVTDEQAGEWSPALRWAAVALVLVAAWVAVVRLLRRRRRSALRSGPPERQVAGAWVWARDCLDEARLPLEPAATPDRVADPRDDCADDLPPVAAEPLRRLAVLCSRALYAPTTGPVPENIVDQAWQEALSVERAAGRSGASGTWNRVRGWLLPPRRGRWRGPSGEAASLTGTVVGRAPRDS